jgi:hypothetical protein
VERIYVAQDRDRWRALVNTGFWFHKRREFLDYLSILLGSSFSRRRSPGNSVNIVSGY